MASQPVSDAVTKQHRLGDLKTKGLFTVAVLEAGKSEISEPHDQVLVRAHTHDRVFTCWEGEGARGVPLQERCSPF